MLPPVIPTDLSRLLPPTRLLSTFILLNIGFLSLSFRPPDYDFFKSVRNLLLGVSSHFYEILPDDFYFDDKNCWALLAIALSIISFYPGT